MISFKKVTKEYKNHSITTALDNVTFEIKEGEFVFIVGPSGSGKSTIVRMLVREEVPTSGTIYFNDVEITKLKRKGLPVLRREMGVVFQDYKLLSHKTVFENVAFLLEVSGKKDDEIKKTTNSILDLVGLIDRTNNFPQQLAGGEMQRVAIARALANDPQVLIADEPTGNLDPANAWDVIQLLNKINSWGTTVIMATHEKDIVDAMKRRVIELEHGRIIRDEGKGEYYNNGKEEKLKVKSEKFKKTGGLSENEVPSTGSRLDFPTESGQVNVDSKTTTEKEKAEVKKDVKDSNEIIEEDTDKTADSEVSKNPPNPPCQGGTDLSENSEKTDESDNSNEPICEKEKETEDLNKVGRPLESEANLDGTHPGIAKQYPGSKKTKLKAKKKPKTKPKKAQKKTKKSG